MKKNVQVAETNLNVENNEESLRENFRDVESDDEIIWGDDDLNNNQEDLIQILMTQMQNQLIQEILQELNADIVSRRKRMLKKMVKQLIILFPLQNLMKLMK